MRPSVVLAFDTATPSATVALVRAGDLLGERRSRASSVLADADVLLHDAGLTVADLEGLAVGTGPGSFTGLRIGLATALGLALAQGVPVAGVSTLEALATAAPGSLPIIDARRGEIFTLLDGRPRAVRPEELELEPGTVCVGGGAVRYRPVFEAAGGEVPPDSSDLHAPHARFHALLARDFGPADLVQPLYVRAPDAVRRAGARA
jgi:tRNA threonylcarbamoyladenosine biosynthesis protein TsaB